MLRTSAGGASDAFMLHAMSAPSCAAACAANSTCSSWSYVNATRACTMTTDTSTVPPAANSPTREFEEEGTSLDGAGVRGTWQAARRPAGER